MERNIIEILVILMREYPVGVISQEEFEPLSKDLVSKGYSEHEIETAMFWYHNRQMVKSDSSRTDEFKPGSFRILHEVEKSVLRPDAYGYLIEIYRLGLITLGELDAIIEKSVLLGGRKVDVEDIKMFIAVQIMEQQDNFPTPGLSFYMKTPANRIQ